MFRFIDDKGGVAFAVAQQIVHVTLQIFVTLNQKAGGLVKGSSILSKSPCRWQTAATRCLKNC